MAFASSFVLVTSLFFLIACEHGCGRPANHQLSGELIVRLSSLSNLVKVFRTFVQRWRDRKITKDIWQVLFKSDAMLPLFKVCLAQCTRRSSLEKKAIFFFLTSTIILSSLRLREEKFDCGWSKHCYEIAEGCIAGANRRPSPAHFEKLDAPVFQSLPLSLSAEELWETACSWK